MINLEDWYQRDISLREISEELSSPDLSHETEREKVNMLVLNFVYKYLVAFLRMNEGDIREMRDPIAAALLDRCVGFLRLEGHEHDSKIANSLQCLGDLHGSAAIFKEIAFNDRFEMASSFQGLDLGSGSGLLMPAMIIAANRKGIRDTHCLGIELMPVIAGESARLLSQILEPEQFAIAVGNIALPGVHAHLAQIPQPSYWVSETISRSTPAPIEDQGRYEFDLIPAEVSDFMMLVQNMGIDPFPIIFNASNRVIPQFQERVNDEAAAMFPDLVNGLYRANLGASSLKLLTGTHDHHLLLADSSVEFSEGYEGLRLAFLRWRDKETEIGAWIERLQERIIAALKGGADREAVHAVHREQLEMYPS